MLENKCTKHAPVGGVIHVGILQTDTHLTVTIADPGDGMTVRSEEAYLGEVLSG